MFKKQFFPETTIKTLASNANVYSDGASLFKKEVVKLLSVDDKENTLTFSVEDHKTEQVHLRFYPNGVAKKYHCTCVPFEKNSGACKHVVASMLQGNLIQQTDLKKVNKANRSISASKPMFSYKKSEEALNQLIQISKQEISRQTNDYKNQSMKFEFVLNVSGTGYAYAYDFYMKVGLDRLYVVKNVPFVISEILEGRTYEFGKNFTFDPEKHGLHPSDRKMLEVLYDLYQLVKSATPVGYGQSYQNKTELEIPARSLKLVLRTLEKTDGGFIRFGRPPKHLMRLSDLDKVLIKESFEQFPLKFKLEKNDQLYHFSFADDDVDELELNFHRGANIVEWNRAFFFLSSEQYKLLSNLIEVFNKNERAPLVMRSKDLTEFASTVLSQLSSFLDIEVEEAVQETVYRQDMIAQCYIDTLNDQLLVSPVFKYGEVSIYPLRDQPITESVDKVIIRQLIKEDGLLRLAHECLSTAVVVDGHWVLDSLDELSEFLYESLPMLSEEYEIFMSTDARQLIYEPKSAPSISIELNRNSNLLDINFDAEDIATDELREIIKQLNNNKQFYRLSNGKILNLKEEKFKELNDTVQKMDIESDDISEQMTVPVFQGLTVLEDSIIKKGNRFRKLAQQLLEPQNLSFDLPDTLNASLRPYQETGYNWLKSLDYYGFGGVLADDMGLGKTLQTIAFLLSKTQEVGGQYLIVCPSSVLYNWQHEFKKFAPELKTVLIAGSIEEREAAIKEMESEKTSILITSYPLIQRDFLLYNNYHFKTIVLDESQNVKNSSAKTTQAVHHLKAGTKFALSGTPIENNLGELWSLFSIVQPGLFKNRKAYKKATQTRIAAKIRPFVLRRLKRDVLSDLPAKTETTEYIDLSTEQKRIYQSQLTLIREEVKGMIQENTFDKNRIRVLAGMTRLRQICCDPALIMDNYTGTSSKLERLLEYLEEARMNGKRVVLFSQFTSMLSIIRERLDSQSIDYHYLDGQTKNEDRLKLTTRFNMGEKDLFLISLKAGGTGLNLTGGDTVILYDSWWNPAIEDQAADRVHRYGQKNAVQIIRLIATGTIEERINELQAKKRELIDTVIETGNEQPISSLTKEEVLSLLTE
ncbi:DEAD/DEAH box helicase [Marinilactibacillus psychrotolerans]|uniref:SNF2 family DNA/RNA helicase n=1 Tax=Marinilactibacillus psychrotolerans TaxID=191770 RepID=A0AAV3WSQ0_9LACT|nr:DEAD/DEAH box helicase [Marinilactibacillus psychrotolerans]GEL67362.1 helicase SNF2 [Marinilactibacillus psychrotolerans]GEQ36305.1 SNF2 family DNA/RNA helicase [Marinilactibacillus psychrotolerans]SDC94628.1 Superfamily II DNA or RNA helicase, SNF2 family [Marinilactibacillus psychrotolerans]